MCGIVFAMLWVGASVVFFFPYFLVEWSRTVMCVYSFGRVVVPLLLYFLPLVLLIESMALPWHG